MKSRLAIAGFVIPLIFLIIFISLPFWNMLGDSFLYPIFFALIALSPFAALLSTILSIISLVVIHNKKLEGKWYAILGIIFDVIIFILVIWFIKNLNFS